MAEIKANRYLVVIFTLWHCYYCICNETVFNHPARSASRAFSGKRDKAKRDKRGSACVVVFNKLLVGSNSEIETCQGPMTMSSWTCWEHAPPVLQPQGTSHPPSPPEKSCICLWKQKKLTHCWKTERHGFHSTQSVDWVSKGRRPPRQVEWPWTLTIGLDCAVFSRNVTWSIDRTARAKQKILKWRFFQQNFTLT